jgi:hypothetical protein
MKWILFVLGMILMLGCTQQAGQQPSGQDGTMEWRDAELKDTKTGETFRISDFKGKEAPG